LNLPINKIICGDCIEVMKKFPDESIDMILTDPPFMISREIKIHRASNLKYKGKDINLHFGSWDAQWRTREEYLDWCKLWLSECVRLLKPYRHLVFFFDRQKVTPIWDFLESMDMKGRGFLYWLKTNPVPRGRKVDMMRCFETAFWFTKTAVKQDYYNWQLGQQRDYVEAPIPGHTTKEDGERCHPCQKPVKVAKVWIAYLSKPGDIILDPFTGSGTFCLAAVKLGRKFIGIEIDPKYVEKAKEKVAKEISQLKLFTRGE